MKCPQCNTITSDSSKFCPVCGMALEVRRCKSCSAPLSEDAKFCANCGAEQIEHKVCANCQAELEEAAKFCTFCGMPTEPIKDPMEEKYAVRTLVFGILGAAFSLSFWLSFLGIIFSAIARGNLKKYLSYSGKIKDARAGVGNGLSIGGLIAGIIMTALFVIFLFCLVLFFDELSGLMNDVYGGMYDGIFDGGFEAIL